MFFLFTNFIRRLSVSEGHNLLLMNAIINLNHFCENHGPQTIFSTQTIRERALLNSCHGSPLSCLGCGSIGTTVFTTTDKDSPSILFVSSEKNIIGKDSQNSSALITLRSLSCEVSPEKLA